MKSKFAFAVAASLVLLGSSVSLATAAPPSGAGESAADQALSGHASVNAGGVSIETAAEAKDKPAAKKRPHLDVAFCIDTTGSMQGEIDMVKKKTKEMVAKLSAGKPTPVIRVGLVAYRDKGDAYVTKVFPFSQDIDQVVKDISDLQAQGGGDGPEAVDQGLHAAIKELLMVIPLTLTGGATAARRSGLEFKSTLWAVEVWKTIHCTRGWMCSKKLPNWLMENMRVWPTGKRLSMPPVGARRWFIQAVRCSKLLLPWALAGRMPWLAAWSRNLTRRRPRPLAL